MKTIARDVVAFCRLFGSLEREQVCCGTVTVAQCVALQTLLEGDWDVSSLARESRVTKGAMTRLLDGLSARGWVERLPDPDDGRRWRVALTREGRAEAQRLERVTEESVQLVLSRIPAERRARTIEAVGDLRRALEEVRDRIDCC